MEYLIRSNPFLLVLIISTISFVYIIIKIFFLYFLYKRNNLIAQLLTFHEKGLIWTLFSLVISPIFALLISYTVMIAIARGNMSWSWHILGGFYVFSMLFFSLVFEEVWGANYNGTWIIGLLAYILSIFFHSFVINNFIVKLYSSIFKLSNTWFVWVMFIVSSYFLLFFWYKIIGRLIETVFLRGKDR